MMPGKAKFKKVKTAKRSITLKWKKAKRATGYQIAYSTSKRFKKHTKYITLKKRNITSKKIRKLKSQKRYYIKIRSFKKIRKGRICSKWSKAISRKTR